MPVEKARRIRLEWEADKHRLKELEGILNMMNQCGDVNRALQEALQPA